MVVNAAVAPDGEVFNTYGAKLTNAELLVRYGFMLDSNDNDILTWTIEEVWDAAGSALTNVPPRRREDDAGYAICMEILRDWQYDAGWGDSDLVIDTEPDENRNPLYMTADGVLSHELWLAIALVSLRGQSMTIEAAQIWQLVARMARMQIQMEQGQTRARNEGSDNDDDDDDEAYEVRASVIHDLLAHAQADIENAEHQIKIMYTTTHNAICTGVVDGRLDPLVRGKTACAPASGDAESTGVGQAGSHDRGIVRAEVGSDFPFKCTTSRRSRSWLA
jgi:hypothetical protein